MTATLLELLRSTADQAGSDLHLTAGSPPLVRERGGACGGSATTRR